MSFVSKCFTSFKGWGVISYPEEIVDFCCPIEKIKDKSLNRNYLTLFHCASSKFSGDVVAGFILGVATMYWNCAYIMGLFSTSSNHQRNKVSDSYFAVRTYSTGSQTSSLDSLDDPHVSNEPREP